MQSSKVALGPFRGPLMLESPLTDLQECYRDKRRWKGTLKDLLQVHPKEALLRNKILITGTNVTCVTLFIEVE